MKNLNYNWNEIYEYYYQKGFYLFIINEISNILIGFIISISPILLFGCFNWEKVQTANYLSEITFSFIEGFYRTNFFIKICSIMFFFFTIIKFLNFINNFNKFKLINQYFNDILKISNEDLYSIEWNEVVESIIQHDSSKNVSLLQITQEILRFDNYLMSIISDDGLLTWKLPPNNTISIFPMSQFFIYFLKISLNGNLLDKNGNSLVNGTQTIRIPQVTDSLKFRFRFIGIILFIFSPFVFIFQILYLFFYYFQAIKTSPNIFSMRRWTEYSKWLFRDYNELPHQFNKRILLTYLPTNNYLDQFPSLIIQPIAKIFIFFSSSIIGIILIIGLFTDINLILSLKIFNDKTLMWLITLLTSIYSFFNSLTSNNNENINIDDTLQKIEEIIHFDFKDDRNSSHSWKTQQKISEFFQPLWNHLILELTSVLLNPFIFFFVLPLKSFNIVDFIRRNSIQHPLLGWICSYSTFDEMNSNINQNLKFKRSISYYHSTQNNLMDFGNENIGDSIFQQEDLTPKSNSINNTFPEVFESQNLLISDLTSISPLQFIE